MTDSHNESSPLAIEVTRDRDELVWRVKNSSSRPIWAYLLVPEVINGALSFAVDSAWLEAEGGVLLVRKVDTPIPDDIDVDDRIRSGAVLLAPGAVHEGRLRLGDTVRLRVPYRSAKAQPFTVKRVVMEVGWVPVRDEHPKTMLRADGHEFVYLLVEQQPGGQRFARSAELVW